MDRVNNSGSSSGSKSKINVSDTGKKYRCTCGCGERLSKRQIYRHLRKRSQARIQAEQAELENHTSNLGRTEHMEEDQDLEIHADGPDEDHTDDMQVDDVFMNRQVEETPSDDEESTGDWYEVGTPPPSPPTSPFRPPEDQVPSDTEEGYQDVNADDYREYERWYAEDCEAELREFVQETLTDEEIDSIKMLAIKQFGHISVRNYERIRYSFRDRIRLLSLQRMGTRLAFLSGVKPEDFDCCVNVCHAFTDQYADEDNCSSCGAPRYDSQGRPRKICQYIPFIPRFQALFNNPDMIKLLEHRHNYPETPGVINDFFDGQLYKDLRKTNTVVNGVDTGAKFFSGKYDIATSILSDGVQIFENASEATATCWPIMLQNLNLPPADRAQLRNIIPVCVIPGPKQPKDFDSFLVPFVKECQAAARGVKTYNVCTGEYFTLRHHPVLVSGDMQAIKHYEQMKGPNAKVPCRGCLQVGCYHYKQRTYYIPLAQPLDPRNPAATTTSYDPLNLPLRTQNNMKRQIDEMNRQTRPKDYEELAKKYGISGPSILDRIPSISRPSSYPHEFLHLFLLNHGPNLVDLWTGSYKNINDAGCEDYLISKRDWAAIGRETEAANQWLPTAFTRKLPNIQTSPNLYCGESWSFWLIYVGPIVLYGRLPDKYYRHYMEYVNILKCLLEFENTTARIEQLRVEIAGYVERFEEYYYQYNYDRLCVCKLTVHALLHVADDILRCGPVSIYWSFGTERYCREIIACARSMVIPYSAINKYLLQMAQLATVAARFAEIRKSLLFGKADIPVHTSRMEHVYEEYPDIILRCPRLPGFKLEQNVRKRIAAHFRRKVNPKKTFSQWLKSVPHRAERWGKLRIDNRGDNIRSARATNPLSSYGSRDASFVRFVHEVDRNASRSNAPIEMVEVVGYGRLDFIAALVLPADPLFGIDERLHVLAHITEAKDAYGDATIERVSYTKLGRSFVLDVTAVKHVVGRIETRGVKSGGGWVIIDRSGSLVQTVFYQEQLDLEPGQELGVVTD
ncbi:Transposase family tnp2 [Ceratobasidium sp. AG-Ba]|nr:Transposase family tnp2 [Ceratobasidium sp. AG-Ba]QRW06141.1 Transposase family tnp2 [Ceratobasidium sp. AG-Ba]